MTLDPRRLGPLLLAAAVGAALAAVLHATSPPPSADVGRGSEDAFAAGLHAREIPPGRTPHRWTAGRSRISFRHLPEGPARLEVRLRGHRGPVIVSADGVVLGRLEAGAGAGDYDLPGVRGRSRRVELEIETFRAGDGRDLGAQLDRVTLHPRTRGSPPLALLALFAGLAAVATLAAGASGIGGLRAAAAGIAFTLVPALLLWPHGLVRSPYAATLAAVSAFATLAAAAFARWSERRWPGSGGAAFLALLAAVAVQGLAATWPAMVVSDALMQANKVALVAGGDFFPLSRTQHAPPFEFPYGISFQILLAPLWRAGLDGVTLVRVGAAVSAVAASAALFVLAAPLGHVRAALAVVLLQLLPGTFDAFSFGNLTNVFGQALTVVFLAWWTGRARGGWPAGAVLIAAAGLAHLSSAIVLAAFLAALVWLRRATLDRTRVWAAVAGTTLIAAYYAHFIPLVLRQLPRFLEGGRQGPSSTLAILALLTAVVAQWGIPVLVLAVLGRLLATLASSIQAQAPPRTAAPVPAGGACGAETDRLLGPPEPPVLLSDLAALWLAGALLALVGVVSPLEVRYLYALAPALAVASAGGALDLLRRGPGGQAAAVALLAAQAVLALRVMAEALLFRYR